MKRNPYQRMADQIAPDTALVERTQALLRKAGRAKRPRLRRMAMTAAAVIAALIVGTSALASYLSANPASPLTGFIQNHTDFFENVFWGNSDAGHADSLIGSSVQDYNASATGYGYSFTLENNLYDANTEMGIAYFIVTNPDGLDGFGEGQVTSYLHNAAFPPELDLRCDLGNGSTANYNNPVVSQACIDLERSTADAIYLSVCYMIHGSNYDWKKAFEEPVLWIHLLDRAREDEDRQTEQYRRDPDAYVLGSVGIPLTSELTARTLYGHDGKPLLTVSPIGIRLEPEACPDNGHSDPTFLQITYKNGETYLVMDKTKDDFYESKEGDTYSRPTFYTINYIYACGFDPAPRHTFWGDAYEEGLTWKVAFDRVIDPAEIASIVINDFTFAL